MVFIDSSVASLSCRPEMVVTSYRFLKNATTPELALLQYYTNSKIIIIPKIHNKTISQSRFTPSFPIQSSQIMAYSYF